MTATASRYVYLLHAKHPVSEPSSEGGDLRALLGGKGANLAEMTRLGLPVPPGFVVSTQACRAFLGGGEKFPDGLWEQIEEAVRALEGETGKRFGDLERPLLVSCRSGARDSMPGMMDTVLDLGLNDEVTLALARQSGSPRFAWDSYRRLIQMFSTVVVGLPHGPFEEILAAHRRRAGVSSDTDLPADDLRDVVREFKRVFAAGARRDFPVVARDQLREAVAAVFRSWNGKRAKDYRRAAGIPDDLGTAVTVMAMVFGNLGEGCGTGVATTRNVSTGEPLLEGDFLLNAQGEDVVSGTRETLPVAKMAALLPDAYAELTRIAAILEQHYRDVQDIEFTIERGRLWMLQTRNAKRTARAAVRIAVDLANEGRINREDALCRVRPEHVDFFLHPQFQPQALSAARKEGLCVATGLNVSPGAAVGQLAFDADTAERWARSEKRRVVMIRPETRPDDVHGLLACAGVVTSRGGRTSHAALVARQFGKPAVVGASTLEVDLNRRQVRSASGRVLEEGDWVSIDGGTGEIFAGELPTEVPSVDDAHLLQLLGWADRVRRLGVWANADYPRDAQRARALGAEGIGLCRTEHMFFEPERLPLVQSLILAKTDEEKAQFLRTLLPLQRADFEGLFRAMDGLPVTIRLIDPPLHEFLPSHDVLLREVTELETRQRFCGGLGPEDAEALQTKQRMLEAVHGLREQNPMLGLRGVRLGIHMPSLVRMQVRAVFEAACACVNDGVKVLPKVMIPLTSTPREIEVERALLEDEARKVMAERDVKVPYQMGTMIEIPRAALVADQIAQHAEFFSFGTNDLTQTTFGISRDDAESGFLLEYLQQGLLAENPFGTLDQDGVGQLMILAVEKGRAQRPGLDVGICGEHGGDPASIAFCHQLGIDYVSCSPFRVPIARLAAAHAALAFREKTSR